MRAANGHVALCGTVGNAVRAAPAGPMRSKARATFILVRHGRGRSAGAHLPPVALAMWPQIYISAPIPTIDVRICTRRHPIFMATPGLRHAGLLWSQPGLPRDRQSTGKCLLQPMARWVSPIQTQMWQW